MKNDVRSAQDTLAEFYEKYYPTVYRVCFSFMKNSQDALDMVQETFMRYLETENKPTGERHETGWLVMTAGNLCRNALKSSHRSRVDELRDDDIVSGDVTASFELLQSVLSLPEKYKTAVYLYYYEGFSTSEIAEATDTAESTVRSLLRRARAKLKKALGE